MYEECVQDLIDVNKLVRAERQYNNVPLYFPSKIEKPMLVIFHDASWASRKDMSSQGGLLTVLTDESVMTGQVKSFSPIAWQPRRLPRVCRSSTAAEVQMASSAIDSHEFVKQTLIEWFNFNAIDVQNLGSCLQQIRSVIVTDSQNFYDSIARIASSELQLEEMRLSIEILSLRERQDATGTSCKWVDSDLQFADSLSKAYRFEAMLLAFQRCRISLLFDPSFMSARKKRAEKNKVATWPPVVIPRHERLSEARKNFHRC